MSTQKLLSVLFTAFFLSLALVSAATSFTATSPATLSQFSNTTTFTITAIENGTVTVPSSVSLGGATVSLSPSGSLAIDTSTPRTITVATTAFPSQMGSYSGSFVITRNSTDNQTLSVNFNRGFCDYGDIAVNASRYFEISSIKDTTSDDDWKWKPLDIVEVDVKVKFTNTVDNDDSIDGIVELGLYDTQDNTFIDLGEDDILEEDVSLDEGKSATVKFTINVPIDVSDGSGRYKLYVKVYEDGDEDQVCRDYSGSSYSEAVTIEKNSYDVSLKDIEVTDDVPCGQEVQVKANVYNVGTHDEDKIYVGLENKELKLDMESDVFSIAEGDEDPYKLTFTFLVPKNASEKSYKLSMHTYFKYSDSSDTYREESDEFTISFDVSGSCSATPVSGSSAANFTFVTLSDDTPKAVIGSQVVVEATVKNTGSATAVYTVGVTGNSQWSKVATIDPQTFTLNAGESKKVSIYMDINGNATEGEKEFSITATSGATSTEQKVKFSLEKGLTSSAIIQHFKTNWLIYTIILVNLILIIAIILVVKSIVSSRA
jgi:uncharacterized membrane protein